MANVYLKVKTDKEREEERCGGCDCFETDDGCECRRLPCSKCGAMDNFLCDDCANGDPSDEEEEEDYEED